MAATQSQLALQMIAQLRMLDPSISAELGTPERKILDTVAQALSDSQIDLVALQGALDVDSKFGANLDRFLALFGFGRQGATAATGFVTFSRITAATLDTRIPLGTQVQAVGVASTSNPDSPTNVAFSTTFEVILPAGDTSVIAPIRANLTGDDGNVAAGSITDFIGTGVLGVTNVTNETSLSGGKTQETDDEFKTRFKNTVFRNLAGTQDQYLALAVSTAFSTKANVVGPVSRYREYIQVPPVDDANSYDINGDLILDGGGGATGEYTSALSTVPFSQHVWSTIPYFVSNGSNDLTAAFYRPDVDLRLNITNNDPNVYNDPRTRGDTLREANTGLGTWPNLLPNSPNITFLNVYTGIDADVFAVRPNDVVLFEHSYLSTASRNDFTNKIFNAVDVYVDGGNETFALSTTVVPTTSAIFVTDSTSKYYYENYRRVGEPKHRPIVGNVLTPLFWQPVLSVPDQLVVNGATYESGLHYWPIEDISSYRGTIRARSGIEWSTTVKGIAVGDNPTAAPGTFTGPIITAQTAGTRVDVDNYSYDKNIADLQAALDGSKQVTTDVLGHKAKIRYFKLDVTVMYTPGVSVTDTNTSVRTAVDTFLKNFYYGSAVQLSDLLQVVHNVPGIDNVRWSADLPHITSTARVFETSSAGAPLTGAVLEMTQPGTAILSERWQMYFTGTPTAGTITVAQGAGTAVLAYNVLGGLQTQLRTLTGDGSLTVVGGGTSTSPFIIDYVSVGAQTALSISANNLTAGANIYGTDFFLADDELAALALTTFSGDTVPGLIIRPRAQNTWTRS